MRNLIVLSLISIISIANGKDIRVDDDAAANLNLYTLNAYSALTSRDCDNLVALWIGGEENFREIKQPANLPMSGVAGGAWSTRGFSGRWFSRLYDGITDYDTLAKALEDSFDWRQPFWMEIIFKGGTNAYSPLWRKYHTGGTGYILGYHSDGSIRTVYNSQVVTTSSTYEDNRWHSLRLVGNSDTLTLYVDEEARGLSISGNAENGEPVLIGSSGSGSRFQGEIALIAYHTGVPTAVERDTLYNLFKEIWSGSSAFPSMQMALDHAATEFDGDGLIDTISVEPGIYVAPVRINLDSVLIRGRSAATNRLRRPSSSSPNAVIHIESARKVFLNNFYIENGNETAVLIDNSSSIILKNIASTAPDIVGIRIQNGTPADSVHIDHCTFKNNTSAIISASSDSSKVLVSRSIITSTRTMAVIAEGKHPLRVEQSVFWFNQGNYSGNIVLQGVLESPVHWQTPRISSIKPTLSTPARWLDQRNTIVDDSGAHQEYSLRFGTTVFGIQPHFSNKLE